MSETHAISLKRSTALLAALTFMAMLTVVNLASFFGTASAAQLSARSLTLSSTLPGDEGATTAAGSETNGADAVHTVQFNVATTGNIGGIRLEYCTNAVGTCDQLHVDEGLVVTGATLEGQTGLNADFDIDTASNNVIDIETTDQVAAKTANDTVSVSVGGITNPTVAGTFFVRITTYSNTAGGTAVDNGVVSSAITEGIYITTRVAETLGFSTTGSFAGVGAPGSTCAPLTGSGAITLGDSTEQTLSLTQAYDNYSAFRVYTNAASGVSIQYEGDTLRRGTNPSDPDIDPINSGNGTAIVATPGTEQFGLAVDLTVGEDPAVPITSSASTLDMTNVTASADLGTNGPLTIDGQYDGGGGAINGSPDAEFAFLTNSDPDLRVADEIAASAGYVECKTVAVRYVANINPTTTSGTYTTTIVYSAVPTY